ncbi:uncharacterized protein SPPG_02296 [Spizellomyces punctatus DAOM BR117]|uniref:RanBD1 domain-containing protein n=1 Tax=Spizellomyces punctatus (strain DAOM BR117) TaxID=645134 RepID=A0A0L0HQA6_SPIPD|nr:uncharacterized protein SPPG_02296 [Spizellomyces punctatus DAOM BR117]KND03243.1 hypothetical protein SPPG_02296 [Spizellomyces punctatus DAOM BR117]|eukprot:XP_016611282.1 hypothetical protein SPPG_02296 [Spizellomyces punctatus DAOM BR117]
MMLNGKEKQPGSDEIASNRQITPEPENNGTNENSSGKIDVLGSITVGKRPRATEDHTQAKVEKPSTAMHDAPIVSLSTVKDQKSEEIGGRRDGGLSSGAAGVKRPRTLDDDKEHDSEDISRGSGASVKRPRTPDDEEEVTANAHVSDKSTTEGGRSTATPEGTPEPAEVTTPTPREKEPKTATNPFLKDTGKDVTWDDLVEEEDEDSTQPAAPSQLGTPMKISGPSAQSSPIFPSSFSTGFGGWSSWGQPGNGKADGGSISSPSFGLSSAPNSAMSTPHKSNVNGPVFGSNLSGSAFASFAASPLTFASLASPSRPTESKEKVSDDSGSSFPELLAEKLQDEEKNSLDLNAPSPLIKPVKHDLAETKAVSGEEDEETIYQTRGKLFVWDASVKGKERWRERGKGMVKVNVKNGRAEQGRLVMRSDGSLRLILNTKIFSEMKCKVISEKYVEFLGTTVDQPGQIAKFLLQFNKREPADELKEAIDRVLEDAGEA